VVIKVSFSMYSATPIQFWVRHRCVWGDIHIYQRMAVTKERLERMAESRAQDCDRARKTRERC